MKALDTNVIVRFLLNDDPRQARRARKILIDAEETKAPLRVTVPVLLELIWVLGSAYRFSRAEVLDAIELLAAMPALSFDSYELVIELVTRGRRHDVDLDDLLIGLCGEAAGCSTTVTFDKKLPATGLFEPA